MVSTTVNTVLHESLLPGATIRIPYPENKARHHFIDAGEHKLSIGSTFFRFPRDFFITFHTDCFMLHWRSERTIQAGTLLHLNLDEPLAEHYRNTHLDIEIAGLVAAPVYLINLGAPQAENHKFYFEAVAHPVLGPIALTQHQPDCPRNITLHSDHDNSSVLFTLEGNDLYGNPMIEQVMGPSPQHPAIGLKAFASMRRIQPNQPCRGMISAGTGNILGLPVFIPGEGYVLQQVIDGKPVTDGQIIAGATDIPSATTGDRRGTYAPSANHLPNGHHVIHLLAALVSPGNIGIPDYEG